MPTRGLQLWLSKLHKAGACGFLSRPRLYTSGSTRRALSEEANICVSVEEGAFVPNAPFCCEEA